MRLQLRTSLLYVLPALAALGVWYTALFYENPPGITPQTLLTYSLNEGTTALLFRWFLVFPIICIFLAVGYASNIATTRQGTLALASVGLVVAVASWFTLTSLLAALATAPLYYGIQCATQIWKREAVRP